ncbi:GNAT family N-acyltransferase [Roseivivax sp. CAU 1761]
MSRAEALPPDLVRGRYRVRAARDAADRTAALALRSSAFRPRAAAADADADRHDAASQHMLVEPREGGAPRAVFRLRSWHGTEITQSYAGQFYDLTRLGAFPAPMLELGRFCLSPGRPDPDLLRLAWAAIGAEVDRRGAGLLFGCASFVGADPARHVGALAALAKDHMAPERWRPAPGPAPVHRFAARPGGAPDPSALPPLLRSYLALGGWVSDFAVIDADLDTLHVFVGVEVARIPPGRARLLRALAAGDA